MDGATVAFLQYTFDPPSNGGCLRAAHCSQPEQIVGQALPDGLVGVAFALAVPHQDDGARQSAASGAGLLQGQAGVLLLLFVVIVIFWILVIQHQESLFSLERSVVKPPHVVREERTQSGAGEGYERCRCPECATAVIDRPRQGLPLLWEQQSPHY